MLVMLVLMMMMLVMMMLVMLVLMMWTCMAIYGHAWPYMAIHGIKKSQNREQISKNRKIKISLGAQKYEKIRKTRVSHFLPFYPLFGRFRLSRVFQSSGFEEIYRLV